MKRHLWTWKAAAVAALWLSGCGSIPGAMSGSADGPSRLPSSRGTALAQERQLRKVETFHREENAAARGSENRADAESVSFDSGSLWSAKSPFFFADRRASRVGDILTVVVSETSSRKIQADLKINKDSSLAYTVPAIPGYGEPLNSPTHRARRFDPNDTLRATSVHDHDSKNDIERQDNLAVTLAARVVEVFPNGNLFVEGRREITTDKETLIVSLSGIVRPDDIDANNSVQSKNIADAKVVYTGDGVLAEAQQPGFLARLANILWPF